MALAEVEDVADFLRSGHRRNELAHVGDVSEELLNGGDAIGRIVVTDEGGGKHFEEVFDVAEEEIVLIAVVGIKSRAADFGAVEDMLDGDGLERLFVHEGDESIAEAIASRTNATVEFLWGF